MTNSTPTTAAPTLTLQSVVYHNEPPALLRAITALAGSAARAEAHGAIGAWALAIGNTGSSPLDPALVDGIASIVESSGGTFTLTEFDQNLGHGGGHNRLSAEGTSDLIAFVNPDGIIDPIAVTELVEALSAGAGIADARQLPLEHPKAYDATTGVTGWASGAFAIMPRDVFREVGGFDADTFFLYCDDVDLSWRVRLAGRHVRHVPSARMFHDKRLTLTADYEPSDVELYYSAEASILLAHKYSRSDIVDETIALYRGEKKPHVLRAVAEYERRAAEGALPGQLDADHAVAEFSHGLYTEHRF